MIHSQDDLYFMCSRISVVFIVLDGFLMQLDLSIIYFASNYGCLAFMRKTVLDTQSKAPGCVNSWTCYFSH